MIARSVNLSKFQSFFLFGPRGTGKSTLLRQMFPEQNYYWIDLLNPETESRYLLSPSKMLNDWQMASNHQRTNGWIVINKIQKVPKLLDVVHLGIENHGIKFAMTGSSARKLRHGGSNLLAGRAVTFELHPFSSLELGNDFVAEDAINYVLLDILKANAAAEKHYSFSYLRTDRGLEIDVIATRGDELLAIEIKSTTDPDLIDVRKYARLVKAIDGCRPYIFCRTDRASLQEGVEIVPWQQGVEQLFAR